MDILISEVDYQKVGEDKSKKVLLRKQKKHLKFPKVRFITQNQWVEI